eukprot:564690-Prymnesium_polylepis.2
MPLPRSAGARLLTSQHHPSEHGGAWSTLFRLPCIPDHASSGPRFPTARPIARRLPTRVASSCMAADRVPPCSRGFQASTRPRPSDRNATTASARSGTSCTSMPRRRWARATCTRR